MNLNMYVSYVFVRNSIDKYKSIYYNVVAQLTTAYYMESIWKLGINPVHISKNLVL